ncbi:MAG: S41 family peptidase [Dehalococcoidales bacterium]
MPSPVRRIWFLLMSTALILAVLYLGYNLGRAAPPSDKNLATIEDAWNVIQQDYVDPSAVNSSALSQAAVQALMDTLNDPHSAYLSAQDYQQLQNNLAGQYGGIGASVTTTDGQITIALVNPGFPAEAAGLQVGDVILEIDGVSTSGMTTEDVVAKVKGAAGTQVTLLVQHPGETTSVLLTITRANITSVSFKMMGDIAYIDISQFTDTTNDELTPVFQEMATNGAKGIVLDLRDNPGGPENVVVDVASRFITTGTILTVKYNDGSEDVVKATKQAQTTDLPMVVLVNSNSASASEVLTGALQDYGRAVVAGEVTYGKGSVDQFEVLPDGSAIYLTIARWLTPNGHLIEGTGITPNVTLDPSTDWVQWAIDHLHGKS